MKIKKTILTGLLRAVGIVFFVCLACGFGV